MKARGRCWKVGDNVPTDQIVKSHMVIRSPEELVPYVFENLNPEFGPNVSAGDIVVAGRQFGQSSGRAIAAKALKASGIGCIVADSFARTFWRNAFEVGLPALECPGVSAATQEGDVLRVDVTTGEVVVERTSETLTGTPIDPFLLRMLEGDGLIAAVKASGSGWLEERTAPSSAERGP